MNNEPPFTPMMRCVTTPLDQKISLEVAINHHNEVCDRWGLCRKCGDLIEHHQVEPFSSCSCGTQEDLESYSNGANTTLVNLRMLDENKWMPIQLPNGHWAAIKGRCMKTANMTREAAENAAKELNRLADAEQIAKRVRRSK